LKLIIIVILLICIGILGLLFRFEPKNSKKVYSVIFAHRGLHLFEPENTLASYKAAVNANMAIEMDVRRTKDDVLVCFHDRYTKKLLDIPGKLSMLCYKDLKKYNVLGSNQKVPTLNEALKMIDGSVYILIEVNGKLTSNYLKQLIEIRKAYEKEIFFHTKNIFTYLKLKKAFNTLTEKNVFFILNVFRKRITFVKGDDYNSQVQKYNDLLDSLEVELPSIEDISSIIVRSIEQLEDKREILATIGSVINTYESRVKLGDNEHWIYNSLWLHRGIVSDVYQEHSKAGFAGCKRFALTHNISITVEFDVMLHKGEIRCYHRDKIPALLGQSKSCAEKVRLNNSLTLKEVLNIFNGCPNINLAIDIKDYHMRNRVLEDLIIKTIEAEKYSGNFIIMSYNPLVLTYFKEQRPEWLRAQIGHSLKGLRRVPILNLTWILNGILGMLFDKSSADCIVLDNSKWIYYLIAYHKNIRGKPVLIYAPKSYIEQETFIGKDSVANFIIENIKDENAWPKGYINKFKRNEEV